VFFIVGKISGEPEKGSFSREALILRRNVFAAEYVNGAKWLSKLDHLMTPEIRSRITD